MINPGVECNDIILYRSPRTEMINPRRKCNDIRIHGTSRTKIVNPCTVKCYKTTWIIKN